jgi:Zn-dependent protease
MNMWSWSLYLFRFRGIDVRAHWTLAAIVIFDLFGSLQSRAPWWSVPLFLVVLFGSILLHEFGHAFAAQAFGNRAQVITLWMMGGLTDCDAPRRPWPQFAVAAAGPLVNAILFGICYALTKTEMPAEVAPLIGYAMAVNFRLLIFNLIPTPPLDGGRMLQAAMWKFVGLRRARVIGLAVGYPCTIAVIVYAAWQQNLLFMALGVWLLSSVMQEHMAYRMGLGSFGYDSESYAYGSRRNASPSWFADWRERRRQRMSEQREREETAEQQLVDDLLAKVGATGLASLSKQERAILESYSRKQRERQLIGRD